MPFDPIARTSSLSPKARLRALTLLLNLGIPFNAGLGLKLVEFGPERVVLQSPPRRRRKNHVGSAHACALALLGEFPAGLLIAQRFSFSKYRIIIGELKVSYTKQGRENLYSTVEAPASWPEFVAGQSDLWIDLESVVRNEARDEVARIQTRWQIKPWDQVRAGKPKN